MVAVLSCAVVLLFAVSVGRICSLIGLSGQRDRRRWLRAVRVQLLLGLCLSLATLRGSWASAGVLPLRVSLIPPVPGGIVDNWRPPSSPYGPGNRGVDLRASVGDPVFSVGDGTVAFAGQVGGRVFVVIDTGAGLRITLGFLSRTLVRTGQRVKARDVVAYANGPVHVGARQGTTYVDPRPMFARKLVRLTR